QVDSVAPAVPEEVPTYVAPDDVIHGVLGYKFHSGVMAVGIRPPPATLDAIVPRDKARLTVVACPELANGENLGSMVRLCAGFGVDALVIGERSADPFIRQSVRVSMGTIFRLPLVRSADFLSDLRRLREEWGVELIATVLDDAAAPLATAGRGPRVALLFGNEAQGLSPDVVRACDRQVTIPMHYGTDSLNVAVAAGIFLHHFTTRDREFAIAE
ncbi:MAG TPA: RNA methyltransferase, partial [Tepidisphaeraceae bacterium]|nr:RNA methyltransferase [Tepidisphaeraceae bacterium]